MAKNSLPYVNFQSRGDVTEGITGNILAGGDVERSGTISIGGREVPDDKNPDVEKLRQLLTGIQQEIPEIVSPKEALKEGSPAALFTVQGAEAVLKEATDDVKNGTDKKGAKLWL